MVVETINIDIPLMLNDIPFEFKRLQLRLKVFFAMMIMRFKGKLLKSQELNWGKIPHGQFYMACLDCKLTPKPGYFATILQNG